MNNKVLIVQNISHEGPGLLLGLLHERSIGFECRDLSKDEALPDPCGFACVVVLGGPQSANDTTPSMEQELRLIRQVLEAGIPCLGICLGLQVLVKAAGGSVIPAPFKEVGFHEPDGTPYTVTLTPEGRSDPLFRGLPESLQVFQLHGETVVTAGGMVLLGTGQGCRNQVVRVGGQAWGVQCHFEMTREMFATWTRLDPDLMAMDCASLMAEFDRLHDEYARTGRTLLLNFLDYAGVVGDNRESRH